MSDRSMVTLYLDNASVEKVMFFYADSSVEPSNEYILFQAKNEGVAVSVYKKEKQGKHAVVFQGKEAEYEASLFGEVPSETPKAPIIEPKKKEHYFFKQQIGSDEVGTGDYFGPIIVTAAYCDSEGFSLLQQLGVTDSKKMNDDYIRQIGPTLIERFDHSSFSLSPEHFNLRKEKGYNMNKLKAIMHNRALSKLSARHPGITLCQDQFAEESLYYSYLREEMVVARPILFSTKGESRFPSVALASVIARYHFLKRMDELSEELGEKVPFGAGSEVDAFAARLAERIGKENMGKYVKLSFANTKKWQ